MAGISKVPAIGAVGSQAVAEVAGSAEEVRVARVAQNQEL